jgi:acetyl esterase/lipase
LDKIVTDVLIWGGGAEVLIDSIRDFSKIMAAAHPQTRLVVQPGAGHEDFIFDATLGSKEKPEGTKLIESWITERI